MALQIGLVFQNNWMLKTGFLGFGFSSILDIEFLNVKLVPTNSFSTE
ncbi:MAG: hypothetical protein V9E96_14525 [Chitinophagaceae bacterium]